MKPGLRTHRGDGAIASLATLVTSVRICKRCGLALVGFPSVALVCVQSEFEVSGECVSPVCIARILRRDDGYSMEMFRRNWNDTAWPVHEDDTHKWRRVHLVLCDMMSLFYLAFAEHIRECEHLIIRRRGSLRCSHCNETRLGR